LAGIRRNKSDDVGWDKHLAGCAARNSQQLNCMGNPALDQFSQALFSKVAPVIILCGIGGIVLRELVQWLERRAIRFGRNLREKRVTQQTCGSAAEDSDHLAPACPRCASAMVIRAAKRGAKAGSRFWGCPSYPRCRGTREI
jgi:hypothetical protein